MNLCKRLLVLFFLPLLFTLTVQADQQFVVDETVVVCKEEKTLDVLKQELEVLDTALLVQDLDAQEIQKLKQQRLRILSAIKELQQKKFDLQNAKFASNESKRNKRQAKDTKFLENLFVPVFIICAVILFLWEIDAHRRRAASEKEKTLNKLKQELAALDIAIGEGQNLDVQTEQELDQKREELLKEIIKLQ